MPTADGDLLVHLGVPSRAQAGRQPATTGARVAGLEHIPGWYALLQQHAAECNIANLGWDCAVPGAPGMHFWAISNVAGDCETGDGLTAAEIAGEKAEPRPARPAAEVCRGGRACRAGGTRCPYRHPRDAECGVPIYHHLCRPDHRRFDDAVINCAYPCDIHFHDRPGAVYYYLDGVQEGGAGERFTRWRPETADNPTCWQVPLRSLIPRRCPMWSSAVRALDCDPGAYGAIRVMVSLNQSGEAAGVAPDEALSTGNNLQYFICRGADEAGGWGIGGNFMMRTLIISKLRNLHKLLILNTCPFQSDKNLIYCHWEKDNAGYITTTGCRCISSAVYPIYSTRCAFARSAWQGDGRYRHAAEWQDQTFLRQCLADRFTAGAPREALLLLNFEDERLAGIRLCSRFSVHAARKAIAHPPGLRQSLGCRHRGARSTRADQRRSGIPGRNPATRHAGCRPSTSRTPRSPALAICRSLAPGE